jgi:hypothetical protein
MADIVILPRRAEGEGGAAERACDHDHGLRRQC